MPIIIHPSTAGSGGKSVLTVNVTGVPNTSGGSADKTYAQILEAVDRGYYVQAMWDNIYIPLVSVADPYIIFQIANGTNIQQVIIGEDVIMTHSTDLVADTDTEAVAGKLADAKWVLDKFKVYEASLV